MKVIGTASFKDFDGLMGWLEILTWEPGRELVKEIGKRVDALFPEFVQSARLDTPSWIIKRTAKDMYSVDSSLIGDDDWNQRRMKETKEKTSDTLRQYKLFHEEYKQPLNVGVWDETFAYLF